MTADDSQTYGIVMPFVACKSRGGNLDDNAYVAGYECGTIDARLELTTPDRYAATVHTVNLQQLDLIAMRHGYSLATETLEHEGWAFAAFTRINQGGCDR